MGPRIISASTADAIIVVSYQACMVSHFPADLSEREWLFVMPISSGTACKTGLYPFESMRMPHHAQQVYYHLHSMLAAQHAEQAAVSKSYWQQILHGYECCVPLQARYQSAHHPGLVDPLLALAAIELRQTDTASWQR